MARQLNLFSRNKRIDSKRAREKRLKQKQRRLIYLREKGRREAVNLVDYSIIMGLKNG